jgi:ectoine hydroxylase-related dioxygenase (phytanoyl-CoA dioxygenase family)
MNAEFHQFEKAGFHIAADVFTRKECETLLMKLSAPDVEKSRAGARHLLSLPFVGRIAYDERLLELASTLTGRRAIPFRATLFDKSSDSNWSVVWHQDTALPLRERIDSAGWGPWSVKDGVVYAHAPAEALETVIALRVQLDEGLHTNGPLLVLPGSHQRGVLSDDGVAAFASRAAATTCVVPRGGVLAMRPLLIHSSPRMTADAPRRVLHIEYVESLELAGRLHLATC